MLICFFDKVGIVHREFVQPGLTVNADFYCDVLRRLRENVRRKNPQKLQNQNLIIHHDKAPAHRSFKVSQFLAKNNMTVIPHPPSLYSPDLTPCDFFLFPKLKLRMKGRRFDTIEEIQEESQRVLDTIPKTGFQGCFQAWQKRCLPVTCCFKSAGSVEGFGKRIDFQETICSVYSPLLSLARPDWITIARSPFLVRRGGLFCRGDLVGQRIFWIFFIFEWLAKARVWSL